MTSFNEDYSDEERAFVSAFSRSGSCCVTDCQCGRTYFVAAVGHGDYSEGELEGLLEKSGNDPDRYIAELYYSSIDIVRIGGQELVTQCKCGKAEKYIDFLESHLHEIAEFAAIRLKDRIKNLEAKLAEEILRSTALGVSMKEYRNAEREYMNP